MLRLLTVSMALTLSGCVGLQHRVASGRTCVSYVVDMTDREEAACLRPDHKLRMEERAAGRLLVVCECGS